MTRVFRSNKRFRPIEPELALEIGFAKYGDKKAAQRLAGLIADLLTSGEPLPEIAKRYLVDGLRAIAAGTPGDKAFHTAGRKGIKNQDIERALRGRWVMLAYHARSLIESGEAENLHQAVAMVEESQDYEKADSSMISKYYRELFPDE